MTGSMVSVTAFGIHPGALLLLSSPSPHMTDTALAITTAVRASLGLVSSSAELLSISQLFALESELRNALTIVKRQLRADLHGPHSPGSTVDLTGWDSSSEGEKYEDEGVKAANIIGGSESKDELPDVPGPYPMTPPDTDQQPDFWYVVNHGTQVGIFASAESADCAVANIIGGHKFTVESWSDAATLYNEFHRQGDVILVRL